MPLSLEKTKKAYDILREYGGRNPYIIKLKNSVFAYRTKDLNEFESKYILSNHDKEPREINKMVKVADWWGAKKKEEWGTDFVPQKIYITWFLGETDTLYHFYCIYRRSQEAPVECFAMKGGILTDFLSEPYDELQVDFGKYAEMSGINLFPHQEEAVKFLVSRKKCILADEMGSGKSKSSIVAALEGGYEHVLIVCPASLKLNWKNELSDYVGEDEITIVEGSKWKESKFTIINYNILKNFYQLPTEMVKRGEYALDENDELTKVYKEKEVVTNKKSIVADAMGASQLFTSKFDLIIIDEAHRLSNTSSGFYKIMSDFVKRAKPKGIFELSGTPVTNRPINLFNLLKLIDAPVANDWKYYVERYCDGKGFYKKNERDAVSHIFIKGKKKNTWYDLTDDEKKELDELLEKKLKKIWVTNGSSHIDELQEVIKPYYLRRVKEDFGKLPSKSVHYMRYALTDKQSREYKELWDKYLEASGGDKDIEELVKYKKITEGILLRKWLADEMVDKTEKIIRKVVARGDKIVVFCSFDSEINELKRRLGDICVVHNGKMTPKAKNKSVERFQTDDNVKVFLGNIISAGVGLTLISSHIVLFNSFDWVSGNNLQCEDRCHRIGQDHDVSIVYQTFKGTFYEEMLEKVRGKQNIIDDLIISEKEK